MSDEQTPRLRPTDGIDVVIAMLRQPGVRSVRVEMEPVTERVTILGLGEDEEVLFTSEPDTP